MNTPLWWKRFLGEAEAETIKRALFNRDGRWMVMPVETPLRGARIVDIPADLLTEYQEARLRWDSVQDRLSLLPFKYRQRKRKLKIVSLPPNPEPEHAAAIEGKA